MPRKARKARKDGSPRASRLSPQKQAQIAEMWHRGGHSTRAIAREVGVSRQSCEVVTEACARELYGTDGEGLDFRQRWERARSRRLESISEAVKEYDAELATLLKKRQLYANEADYTREYATLTDLIMKARGRADDLRAEYAALEGEASPDEVLALEVEAARRARGATAAGITDTVEGGG